MLLKVMFIGVKGNTLAMGWIQEGMISIGRKNSDKKIIGINIIMVTAEAERLVFTKLAITKESEKNVKRPNKITIKRCEIGPKLSTGTSKPKIATRKTIKIPAATNMMLLRTKASIKEGKPRGVTLYLLKIPSSLYSTKVVVKPIKPMARIVIPTAPGSR
jgi:hypothetical protein